MLSTAPTRMWIAANLVVRRAQAISAALWAAAVSDDPADSHKLSPCLTLCSIGAAAARQQPMLG
jgi:hypothetical protein